MKAVSLYTGAGGLDIGFEAAGFRTLVAVEKDEMACHTLKANPAWFGDAEVLTADINSEAASSARLMAAARVGEGEIDLLIGGPPCQPFSKSAYWASGDTKRLDDPRADTLTGYLRVLRDLKPRAFLLENVSGITYKNKDEALLLLLNTIEQINRETGTNYSCSASVVNAASYGVPQKRQRFILIGSREGKRFAFPAPRFTDPEGLGLFHDDESRWRNAWDAIGDLEVDAQEAPELVVGGKFADLLPSIPEGGNYLYHTPRGGGLALFGWRTRYWMFLLKLAKDRPSSTITARFGGGVGPFHWDNRQLSRRELLRLQTFPDTYKFSGSYNDVRRQAGNAVPALLAEGLGREIASQFFNKAPSSPEPTLLSPSRGIPPRAVPVKPVPASYLLMMGDHADHPGTGKGPLYNPAPEKPQKV